MYWKARFERPKTHESLEQELLLLHDKNPNYGYRRMVQALRREGFFINHKKVQRLMKKLGICVSSYWHKSRKYNSYKGTVGRIAKNKLHRRFWTNIPHQKKLQQIQPNSNIMKMEFNVSFTLTLFLTSLTTKLSHIIFLKLLLINQFQMP